MTLFSMCQDSLVLLRMWLHRIGWHSDHDSPRFYILHHRSAHADDGSLANRQALSHGRTSTDMCPRFHVYSSAQSSTCGDVDMIPYKAIMFYNSSGVHDDINTENSARIDHCCRKKS